MSSKEDNNKKDILTNDEIIEALEKNAISHLEKFIFYFNYDNNSNEYKLFPMSIHLYSFLGCSSKFLNISKLNNNYNDLSTSVKKNKDKEAIDRIIKKLKIDHIIVDKLRILRHDVLHNYYIAADHYKMDYDKIVNIFIKFIEGLKLNIIDKSSLLKEAIEKKYAKDISNIVHYQNGIRNNLFLQVKNKDKNKQIVNELLDTYDIFDLEEIYNLYMKEVKENNKYTEIIMLLNNSETFSEEFSEYISNLLEDNNELIIELYEKLGFTTLLEEMLNIKNVEDIKKIYEKEGYINLWENQQCDSEYVCPECKYHAREYILGKISDDYSSYLQCLEKEFRCIKCNDNFVKGDEDNECPRCYTPTNDGDYCEDCQDYIDKQ